MNTSPITSHAPALLRRSPSAVHRKADPLAGQVLADGLRVSAPSDPLEREAEATANRVMRMQAPAKAGRAPAGELQRACASCDGQNDKAVHRKPASVQRAPAAIASQGGSGSALSEDVRADMEGRFGGQDFSGVRIHAGPQANTLARSYNARAFTTGSDIYFGQGEYSPSSKGGQHLLAHELTHVVQGGSAGVQREGTNQEDSRPSSPAQTSPQISRAPGPTTTGVLMRDEDEARRDELPTAATGVDQGAAGANASGGASAQVVQSIDYRGSDDQPHTYAFTTRSGPITQVSESTVALIRNIHSLQLPAKVIRELRNALQRRLGLSQSEQAQHEGWQLVDQRSTAVSYSLARLLELFRPGASDLKSEDLSALDLFSPAKFRRLWGRKRTDDVVLQISGCIDRRVPFDKCFGTDAAMGQPARLATDIPASQPSQSQDGEGSTNGESAASGESPTRDQVRVRGGRRASTGSTFSASECPGGDTGPHDTWTLLIGMSCVAKKIVDGMPPPRTRRQTRRLNRRRHQAPQSTVEHQASASDVQASWERLVVLRSMWDEPVNFSTPNSPRAATVNSIAIDPVEGPNPVRNVAKNILNQCRNAIRRSDATMERQAEATKTLQEHGYFVRSHLLDQSGWNDRIGGEEAIEELVNSLAPLSGAVAALSSVLDMCRSESRDPTRAANSVTRAANSVVQIFNGLAFGEPPVVPRGAMQRLHYPPTGLVSLPPLRENDHFRDHVRRATTIRNTARRFLSTARGYRESSRVNPAAVDVNLSLSGVEVTMGSGRPRRDTWQLDPVFAVNYIRFLQAARSLGVVRVWTAGFLRQPMSPGDAHPTGNACDITGFTMSSGDVLHLRHGRPAEAETKRDGRYGRGASDWFNHVERVGSGDSAPTKAEVMLQITAIMPQFFDRVVGPGGNAAHMNHWHVEYGAASGGATSMNLVPAEQFYREDGQGSSVRTNPRYAPRSEP